MAHIAARRPHPDAKSGALRFYRAALEGVFFVFLGILVSAVASAFSRNRQDFAVENIFDLERLPFQDLGLGFTQTALGTISKNLRHNKAAL